MPARLSSPNPVIAYDFETQVPTVETGVWEAETTLAQLRLGEDQ